MTVRVDRRGVLAGIAVLLGGCAGQGGIPFGSRFGIPAAYGPINDHGHEIPGLDIVRIDPEVLRRQVAFAGPYRPGTSRQYRRTPSLFRRAWRHGDALQRRRRPARRL